MAMKQTIFRCNPLAPRTMLALQNHRDANPDGLPLIRNRSSRKLYFANVVIYETKTTVVVDTI